MTFENLHHGITVYNVFVMWSLEGIDTQDLVQNLEDYSEPSIRRTPLGPTRTVRLREVSGL